MPRLAAVRLAPSGVRPLPEAGSGLLVASVGQTGAGSAPSEVHPL